MAENRFKYRIVAADETEKGVKSAERRLGGLTGAAKRYRSALGHGAGRTSSYRSALGQASRGISGLVKQAPGIQRYSSALTEVHEAASSAAGSVREAAAAGEGLSGALGTAAVMGGGLVGVLGAVAAGAVKMAAGWAQGASQIAIMSQNANVTAEQLQKVQAVGEQFNISKDQTAGGLEGLAQNLYEAKWGRNNTLLAGMNSLGLAIKTNQDGSIDTIGNLMQISDKIAKQTNPQTQARIADLVGLRSMLPMLREGGAALQSGMDDAGKHAGVSSNDDIKTGVRIYREGVQTKQLGDRAAMVADQGVAKTGEGALVSALNGGRAAADSGKDIESGVEGAVSGAAKVVTGLATQAVHALGGAADRTASAVVHLGGAVAALGGIIEGVNRRTLGGRNNNVVNIRPVGGDGFARYLQASDSVTAGMRQIIRDQDVHGAHTLLDLIAGVPGRDGKRHWGWAPAEDHNDPVSYAHEVGDRTGIKDGAFNAHDPEQLAAILVAMARRETGSNLSAKQVLPYAQKIVLEVQGLPSGTKVRAKSHEGGVAVATAMAGNGP